MALCFTDPELPAGRCCSPNVDGARDGCDNYGNRPFAVGKTVRAHFNPASTFTFCRLGKVMPWDALFYCTAQLSGALAGVALASLLLRGAPAHQAVRFAATLPGIYGDGVAFIAELVISFLLMSVILFATNHRVLAT